MKLLMLELDRFSEDALRLLKAEFDIVRTGKDCDVVWVRLEPINAAAYYNLKCIVSATTGIDHIDTSMRPNVEVLSLKGETEFLDTIHATAEFTIALMLASLRNIVQAAGKSSARRLDYRGRELHGKTVLVVGRGRVGKQVGDILQAFGCLVLYSDRGGNLHDMLPMADIVSVHVDLNPSTIGMFGWREFGLMKLGALFVNTSRHQVVDELALQRASHIRVALDVAASEFRTHLVTPHLGGCTEESMAATELFMARKLVAWKAKLT